MHIEGNMCRVSLEDNRERERERERERALGY